MFNVLLVDTQQHFVVILNIVVVLFVTVSHSNVTCPADECFGLLCLYGRETDKDGCAICGCFLPCQDVQCDVNEKCLVVSKHCIGEQCQQQQQQFTAVCRSLTTDRSSVVMSSRCSDATCDVICHYGFVYDAERQCETCDCYDPCQLIECGSGLTCSLSADCEPSATTQCRDAPMPYCITAAAATTSSSSSSSTTTTTQQQHVNHTTTTTTLDVVSTNLPTTTEDETILIVVVTLMIVFLLSIGAAVSCKYLLVSNRGRQQHLNRSDI